MLEAGVGASDRAGEHGAAGGHEADVARFQRALAKVPSAAIAGNALVPSPEVLDLAGLAGGGFRADGYFVQRGPLPYASGYLRVKGGTGTAWTGLTPRMHPEDFHTEDFGYGRDWPIGYPELEPYYRAAEREIGVAADVAEQRDAVGLPFADGYAFPMAPIPASHLDRVLAARLDGRKVKDPTAPGPTELRVVGTPHGRNSEPSSAYGPACAGSASCIPVCPTGAKYTPARTQARWAPSVALLTRAVVSRVLVDSGGRAVGVEYQRYQDPHRAAHTVHTAHAEIVVLAAHAIENARLLLASGLANSSDQVGRNLMDHPVLLTWGLMPQPIGAYRGPGSTSGLEGFRFDPPGRTARRSGSRSVTGAGAGRPPRPTTRSRPSWAPATRPHRTGWGSSERTCAGCSATGWAASSPCSSRWSRAPSPATASPSTTATGTSSATRVRCSPTTCPSTSRPGWRPPRRSPTRSSPCSAPRTTPPTCPGRAHRAGSSTRAARTSTGAPATAAARTSWATAPPTPWSTPGSAVGTTPTSMPWAAAACPRWAPPTPPSPWPPSPCAAPSRSTAT